MTRGCGAALVLAAAVAWGAAGCSGSASAPARPPAARVVGAGAGARVVLSAEAERRLGIATAPVRRAGPRARAAIPYAALLYDARGRAFTFVGSAGRTFEGRRLRVAAIAGGRVLLDGGPPPGARVVTTGGDELLGTLQGVQAQ